MTIRESDLAKTIPWAELAGPLVAAEDAVARLDERLARSPVRDGFVERFHFHDAAATLWLEGELVHVEDLVLHDAHMDIRAPTHELTRAHAVLRTRRQVFGNAPDWALGREGLRQLTGRDGATAAAKNTSEGEGALAPERHLVDPSEADEPDPLAEEFAAIDAVLARSSAVLEGVAVEQPPRPQTALERDPLVYDPDWDERARLDDWRAILDRTADLPPVLAATLVWDAWEDVSPLQHQPWLGSLLVAACLRQRRKTTVHLLALNVGLRVIGRERRRHRHRTTRLLAFLDAVQEAAALGLKEHDRLALAREQMLRRTRDRRGNSKLPRLIDYVLTRPLVSSGMIEKELRVTTRGALNLVGELGMREITGRGRYRAWGIL
ncbi:RHE_PE00001 family protein [Mesorhizobium sp. VK4C]|uniref:RHE_PE00001 family protein n=1 Tax=Mesorhizobium captivum TaxID=3072319 RepID=UPI002A24B13F|nr:RHE_PE00001 family protein [Mesorhizobium sp. VK4C]MDX8499013.1 RHE_PE00001 family protein [Mesorhizobium sp. VK4C]